MITTLIYNRVPNNTTGTMGYSERRVGYNYQIDTRSATVVAINKGFDTLTLEPVVEVIYDADKQTVVHTIPYKDLELYYEDDNGDIEDAAE